MMGAGVRRAGASHASALELRGEGVHVALLIINAVIRSLAHHQRRHSNPCRARRGRASAARRSPILDGSQKRCSSLPSKVPAPPRTSSTSHLSQKPGCPSSWSQDGLPDQPSPAQRRMVATELWPRDLDQLVWERRHPSQLVRAARVVRRTSPGTPTPPSTATRAGRPRSRRPRSGVYCAPLRHPRAPARARSESIRRTRRSRAACDNERPWCPGLGAPTPRTRTSPSGPAPPRPRGGRRA
jgi:hypothetical protein